MTLPPIVLAPVHAGLPLTEKAQLAALERAIRVKAAELGVTVGELTARVRQAVYELEAE